MSQPERPPRVGLTAEQIRRAEMTDALLRSAVCDDGADGELLLRAADTIKLLLGALQSETAARHKTTSPGCAIDGYAAAPGLEDIPPVYNDKQCDYPRANALWESDDCHNLGKWFELCVRLERELADAKDDCLRLHREKMDALFGPDGMPRVAPSAELLLIDPEKQKPDRDALLLTASKVWIIGDWYQGAWRTHRSAWVNHDGTNVLTSAFRTEDIIGWLPLPIRPDAGWYRRKIAEIGDAEPHVIGVPSAKLRRPFPTPGEIASLRKVSDPNEAFPSYETGWNDAIDAVAKLVIRPPDSGSAKK